MMAKKKLEYLAAASLLIAGVCMAGLACTGWSGKQSGTIKAKVRIVDIAPNDLGQVMIFGESDGVRSVFIKNFYQQDKKKGTINAEIRKYVDSLQKLRGREVTITFRKDKIGDLEVLEIR